MLEILNKESIDSWLFKHVCLMQHECRAVLGEVNGVSVYVSYVDDVTGDRIDVLYQS